MIQGGCVEVSGGFWPLPLGSGFVSEPGGFGKVGRSRAERQSSRVQGGCRWETEEGCIVQNNIQALTAEGKWSSC